MVVMDSSTLLLLLDPTANPPIDPLTNAPLTRCQDRVEFLIENLSKRGEQVIIPTPVLSEVLVVAGSDAAVVLQEITNAYAFKIEPFDTLAAIEVAMMTRDEPRKKRLKISSDSKAKVKYDRQIIAIAKVKSIRTIYSDDRQLAAKAKQYGITVIHTWDFPLRPEPPQRELDLLEQNL